MTLYDDPSRRMSVKFVLLLSVTCGLPPATAHWACAAPMLTFTGGMITNPGSDAVGGWEFSVNSEIVVDGLGVFDDDSDGLDRDHDVGLWTVAGDLLATVTVTNAATPEPNGAGPGRWLFMDIPAQILVPGNYVVAGAFVGNETDMGGVLTSATTVPAVDFVNARQLIGPGLAFPTEVIPSANDGVFGPNVRIGTPLPAPGDANGDGHVDGLDYLVWAGNYATHPGADGDTSDGDFNDDGWIDGLDYLLWAGNYLQGPSDAVAVPEPGTAAALLLTTLLAAIRLRRR